jgi:hypothetical protein
MRNEVAKFVCLLSDFKNKPILSIEEFFCYIRPGLKLNFETYYKDDVVKSINSPEELLNKLKPPLSLDVMRCYFRYFNSKKRSTKEEQDLYNLDLA